MNIAVIGTGTMGLGIAQFLTHTGEHNVWLSGSSIESARHGLSRLEEQLDKRVQKGKLSEEAAGRIISGIHLCSLDECTECELAIEAIPENFEMKHNLLKGMDRIFSSSCIFASNTSSFSVSSLSFDLGRTVVGMHFFNPVSAMKLVEVVCCEETPDEAVNLIKSIVKDLGKTPVIVKDSPGFIVNRILMPLINEAIGLYANGIASAEDIDTAMKLGANHPMGPLELADFIGLDVCEAAMQSIADQTGDLKYLPHQFLKNKVNSGCLGKKSGEGFYRYK